MDQHDLLEEVLPMTKASNQGFQHVGDTDVRMSNNDESIEKETTARRAGECDLGATELEPSAEHCAVCYQTVVSHRACRLVRANRKLTMRSLKGRSKHVQIQALNSTWT